MEPMNERIRKNYNSLTAGQKAVAEYALKEPQNLALLLAKEIGTLTGTSETTVIRFCLSLGYTGYSELQASLRQNLIASRHQGNPLNRFGELPHPTTDLAELTRSILDRDTASMANSYEGFDPALLSEAIASMRTADRIAVVGLRAAYSPAHWLAYTLNIVRGNTILYHGGVDDANHLITEMNDKWLVIALSFPRYARETLQFVQAAKGKSARIMALSDEEISPLGSQADLFLKVIAPQPATLIGMPVIFSLLNILIGGMIARDQAGFQQRLDAYNASARHFYSFIHDDEE